ncbi:MAG: thiN [Burkholderiaceae bacterium]|nr:thiN [Burkholderiaceae bacterium]
MNRVVIFANGVMQHSVQHSAADDAALRALLDADDVICCADGGVAHALTIGLKPQVLIGDHDSIAPEVLAQLQTAGAEIITHPKNKDKTDLHLAIDWAVAQGASEVMLVTALGGRLDHLLANVLLMTHSDYAYIHLTLVDVHQGQVQWACVLHAHDAFELHGAVGDGLSLIPLSPTVESVCLKGTQWPLKNHTLAQGDTTGISNVFIKTKVKIEIGEGELLVVHTSSIGS